MLHAEIVSISRLSPQAFECLPIFTTARMIRVMAWAAMVKKTAIVVLTDKKAFAMVMAIVMMMVSMGMGLAFVSIGLAAGPTGIYGAMPVVFILQGLAGYATWIFIGSLYISIEATDAGVEIEDPLAGI